MKRYSIFHIPVMSFFSKDLYADMGLRWKGTCFGYLLLLLAICWIPAMFRVNAAFSNFVANEAPKIIDQIPAISIIDGRASIGEPQPYYINDPESGKPLVIIDTTGTITSLDGTEAIGLVTRTNAQFRKSSVETRTFDFAGINKFMLDQKKISGWLAIGQKALLPILYPICVIGSYVSRIIQVLIYASIGLLFASWCKSKMPYLSLIRIAVAALTVFIIIRTILGILEITLPAAGMWYFLGAMAYMFFGVRAAASQQESMVQQESPATQTV
jgi:hypothetical protein